MKTIQTIIQLALIVPVIVGGIAVLLQAMRELGLLAMLRLARIKAKTFLRG